MRLLSLLAATGLVTAGLVSATTPATAAGSCSVYLPSRFTISQPYRAIPVKLGPNCAAAGVVDAAWTAYRPAQTPQEVLIFDSGAQSEIVDLYDHEPLGRWEWRPDYAYDASDNLVPQYTYYTDVRLASYGRVATTRSGKQVTLKTTAMRYWQGGSKFIAWNSARGQLQYRTPGTTAWHALKDVVSTTRGLYSYTYTSSAVRDYRLVLPAVSTIWESTSPVVRR
jgi:hypothetical protein